MKILHFEIFDCSSVKETQVVFGVFLYVSEFLLHLEPILLIGFSLDRDPLVGVVVVLGTHPIESEFIN